jgi:4-hydroxy-2-oxoheptanedioate aldolase
MIPFIRDRVRAGELLAGTFCNIGSSLTVEMAGRAGFDWILVDLEHGAGDETVLLHQLHAAGCTPAVVIVRVAWNDPVRFKRVLDLGPAGVMAPYVESPEEARRAAAAMRYPPAGIRGVAKMNRASGFGKDFAGYFGTANDSLLTVVQIETRAALERAGEIAAVDGVDVLFVGPLDLSVSLGIPGETDHPRFRAALETVALAAKDAGKVAGILAAGKAEIGPLVELGYTFVALGSDGGFVASAMSDAAAAFRPFRK